MLFCFVFGSLSHATLLTDTHVRWSHFYRLRHLLSERYLCVVPDTADVTDTRRSSLGGSGRPLTVSLIRASPEPRSEPTLIEPVTPLH